MRGIPGAGKSMWVRIEKAGCDGGFYTVSADSFFTRPTGEYVFDSAKLSEAHNQCLGDFLGFCITGMNSKSPHTLVVDNTNVRLFEIAPYYRIAEAFGYSVQIVWVVCDVQKAIARNVHGVPANAIETMAKSFEPIPHFWNQTIVIGG